MTIAYTNFSDGKISSSKVFASLFILNYVIDFILKTVESMVFNILLGRKLIFGLVKITCLKDK